MIATVESLILAAVFAGYLLVVLSIVGGRTLARNHRRQRADEDAAALGRLRRELARHG